LEKKVIFDNNFTFFIFKASQYFVTDIKEKTLKTFYVEGVVCVVVCGVI